MSDVEEETQEEPLPEDWDEEFFCTKVNEVSVCLICGDAVALTNRHPVLRHFSTCHKNFD